jgi:hypothetical protein
MAPYTHPAPRISTLSPACDSLCVFLSLCVRRRTCACVSYLGRHDKEDVHAEPQAQNAEDVHIAIVLDCTQEKIDQCQRIQKPTVPAMQGRAVRLCARHPVHQAAKQELCTDERKHRRAHGSMGRRPQRRAKDWPTPHPPTVQTLSKNLHAHAHKCPYTHASTHRDCMRVPYSCRKDALCVGVVPTQLSFSLFLSVRPYRRR